MNVFTGKISSVYAVGIEGGAGTVLTLAMLPAIQLLGVERPTDGLQQLSRSSKLQSGSLAYAAASFVNNASGVVVTKWSSGLLRWSVAQILRSYQTETFTFSCVLIMDVSVCMNQSVNKHQLLTATHQVNVSCSGTVS